MSNVVVILIHGYNVVDPRRTVGKFRPYFEQLGCIVENYTYGYWPLPIQITRRNPKFAREVADRCRYWKEKGYWVVLAVHSNGAAIARIAREVHKAPIDRLLAVHPALKRDIHPCPHAKKVIVVHNQGDLAVVAGGWLGSVAKFVFPRSWEKARPWGQMGQDGYRGSAANVRNVDSGSRKYEIRCWGHSDEFKAGKVEYWLPLLAHMILE